MAKEKLNDEYFARYGNLIVGTHSIIAGDWIIECDRIKSISLYADILSLISQDKAQIIPTVRIILKGNPRPYFVPVTDKPVLVRYKFIHGYRQLFYPYFLITLVKLINASARTQRPDLFLAKEYLGYMKNQHLVC